MQHIHFFPYIQNKTSYPKYIHQSPIVNILRYFPTFQSYDFLDFFQFFRLSLVLYLLISSSFTPSFNKAHRLFTIYAYNNPLWRWDIKYSLCPEIKIDFKNVCIDSVFNINKYIFHIHFHKFISSLISLWKLVILFPMTELPKEGGLTTPFRPVIIRFSSDGYIYWCYRNIFYHQELLRLFPFLS